MIGGIMSRAWGYVAAAAVAVGVVLAAWSRGRQSGRDAVAVAAARDGEEARRRADAAAREAQRDGAQDRLRDGRF